MPIYRLSAARTQGIYFARNAREATVLVGDDTALAHFVINAATSEQVDATRHSIGISEITPTYWQQNRLRYFLKMHSPDSATLRMIPVPGIIAIQGTLEELATAPAQDAIDVRIPEEQLIVPITGGRADSRGLYCHEIVVGGRAADLLTPLLNLESST